MIFAKPHVLLFLGTILLLSQKSVAQEETPFHLPPAANTLDSSGRKQGFWLKEVDGWGQTTIDYYKDNEAIKRYCYYDNKSLYWECGLKNDRAEGELRYYVNGELAQLQWQDHTGTNFKKSIELASKKLNEVTLKYGNQSIERSLWLLNVATFYEGIDLLTRAEAHYTEALSIAKSLHSEFYIEADLNALVRFYTNHAMYKKAIHILPELLTTDRENGEDWRYYSNYGNLADSYYHLNQLDSAEKIRREIVDHYFRKTEKDSARVADYLDYYTSLSDLARVTKDSTLIEKMFLHGTLHLDSTSNEYNDYILDKSFVFYYEQNNFRRANEIINVALRLNEINNPKKTIFDIVGWMPDRAKLYLKHQKYRQAELEYLNIINLYRKYDLPTDTGDYGSILTSLANLYVSWGKPKAATKYYELAVQIAKKFPDVPTYYADVLKDYGNHLIRLHEIDKGEIYLKQALDTAALYETEDGPTYTSILTTMGDSYFTAGMSAKSETAYLRVFEAYERNLGKDHIRYVDLSATLGSLYTELGQFDKARVFLNQTMKSTELAYGEDHDRMNSLLSRLAIVEKDQYELLISTNKAAAHQCLDRYRAYTSERLALLEKSGGKSSVEYVRALNDLGIYFLYKGFLKEAENKFSQAMHLIDSMSYRNSVGYGGILHDLALVHQNMGKTGLVNREFKSAIKEEIFSEDYGINQTYKVYGNCLWRQQNWKKANEYLLRAFKGQLSGTAQLPFLTEQEREDYWNTVSPDLNNFNSFLVAYSLHNRNASAQLFDNALTIKGQLLYANSNWKNKIRQSSDTRITTSFEEWEVLKSMLSKMEVQGRQENRTYTDSLNTQIQQLEKFLTNKTADFSKVNTTVYSWKDVRKNLAKDEAAIEFMRIQKKGYSYTLIDSTDSRLPTYPYFGITDTIYYAALIVKPTSSVPELVLFENGKEMEQRFIKYYRATIGTQLKDSLSYPIFWEPLEQYLKEIRTVYVSNDGIYNLINLNTLLNPKTNRFLLEEKEIVYLTNSRDLISDAKANELHKQAVLFGMPQFDFSKTQETEPIAAHEKAIYELPGQLHRGAGNYEELPSTLTEVDNIDIMLKRKAWQTTLFTRDAASEENIKATSNPAVLHIATHGFFLPDENTEGKISPLVKSGLVFAGVKTYLERNKEKNIFSEDKGDDGILTAYEVMSLELDSTELVVLSACETGLGEQRNGEGVYGLQRAFKVAGAKAMIMSLWKVDDQATQELMTAFYSNWIGGDDKTTAFKKAQLTVKHTYADPVYWGGFVMVGIK